MPDMMDAFKRHAEEQVQYTPPKRFIDIPEEPLSERVISDAERSGVEFAPDMTSGEQLSNIMLHRQGVEADTYWTDPSRIARYYNMMKAAPPDWDMPPEFDPDTIEAAYNYYQTQNPDKSWWEWQRLPEDDPMYKTLRQMAPPPGMYMPDRDKQGAGVIAPDSGVYEIEKGAAAQIIPQELLSSYQLTEDGKYIIPAADIEQYMQPGSAPYGVPQYDWDLLPGWQKAAINALPYLGPGMGAFAGGAILGGLLGPAGLVGGAIAGGAIGKAAETNENIMNAMIALDWAADQGEKLIGVLVQLGAAGIDPEKYGTIM